jgi:hypothetical protein
MLFVPSQDDLLFHDLKVERNGARINSRRLANPEFIAAQPKVWYISKCRSELYEASIPLRQDV